MLINDALNFLELTPGHITPAAIKKAYKKTISLYHPDRNPAGLEMTKLANLAYEAAKDFEGEYTTGTAHKNYGEAINEALNKIIHLGLDIEICGAWVWVSGNTKPHKDILKQAGFQWAPKKFQWYFRPEEYKSRRHDSWSLEKIRAKYGSDKVEGQQRHLQASH